MTDRCVVDPTAAGMTSSEISLALSMEEKAEGSMHTHSTSNTALSPHTAQVNGALGKSEAALRCCLAPRLCSIVSGYSSSDQVKAVGSLRMQTYS